jgi:hypothetical protein
MFRPLNENDLRLFAVRLDLGEITLKEAKQQVSEISGCKISAQNARGFLRKAAKAAKVGAFSRSQEPRNAKTKS